MKRTFFHAPDARAAACLAAFLLGFWAVFVDGFQGMVSPTRGPRPVARVDTDLAPIAVDFQDVAGRRGPHRAERRGGESAKKYILETTGNGVALFDYDNDGRVDIFIPSRRGLGWR